MKINGLQILQFIAMIVCPITIGVSARSDDATTMIWSCVVVAMLFIGVSGCSVANAIRDRD